MNLSKLGQALTAREIFDLIQDDLEQVEKKITVESVASVDAVTAIGQYLQSAGGKRLRPALLLLSAKLAGNGGTSAIQLGAVVELIHAATLVHDDVIDTAETRRGRPSTNVRWGNHTSVLAGDWMSENLRDMNPPSFSTRLPDESGPSRRARSAVITRNVPGSTSS